MVRRDEGRERHEGGETNEDVGGADRKKRQRLGASRERGRLGWGEVERVLRLGDAMCEVGAGREVVVDSTGGEVAILAGACKHARDGGRKTWTI